MLKTRLVIAALLATQVAHPISHALGASGKTQVAVKGEVAEEKTGWPKGAMALINDPLRTNGWLPWFTECPNDSYFYDMDVQTPEDVNHLIEKLAEIDAKTLQLNLYPAGKKSPSSAGADFGLGNQITVNKWYERLREVEPGIRAFGVHRFHQTPTAFPPTLTIYLGHQAVDLKKLSVPLHINVVTGTAKAYREEHQEAFLKIDDFVSQHKAKQQDQERASNLQQQKRP